MVAESVAPHPGPVSTVLSATIVDELVAHALREDPNEACGLIVGTAVAAAGGQALRFEPTRNAAASPYRYEIDSRDLLRLTLATDDRDEVFWAIVHSHTHTPARPSPTDIGLALYPDALYILVSLAEADANEDRPSPDVRAWRIAEGNVHEVAIDVAG